jgi:L-aminoadipate-semialdehyde dehydrogenase
MFQFPLNPNGKIDKKMLPYPDAEELVAAATAGKTARSAFSPTEHFVGEIWAQRIPGISADMIDLEDKFFDLG